MDTDDNERQDLAEQLRMKEKELEERENELLKKERHMKKSLIQEGKENLYSRINLSLKTIDLIIVISIIALVVVIVLGIYN